MKMEDLLKKCPECGSQDKTVQRKIEGEHKAHATMKAIVCDKCGHIFESGKKEEE
jgi:Cys-rich peptide (TIGR04165 family)